MHKPALATEYAELIDQAIFEIDEMIVCAEDEDGMDTWFTDIRSSLMEIAGGLRTLLAEVKAGAHVYAVGQDLPFMASVRELKDRLPIMPLLEALNRFHRTGT